MSGWLRGGRQRWDGGIRIGGEMFFLCLGAGERKMLSKKIPIIYSIMNIVTFVYSA